MLKMREKRKTKEEAAAEKEEANNNGLENVEMSWESYEMLQVVVAGSAWVVVVVVAVC